MMISESQKELAYLHDLFVATNWGERFAALIDDNVELPEQGDGLYVASGTGGHVIALQERASEKLKFAGVEENKEAVELARAKASAVKDAAEFRCETIDALTAPENRYELVIGDASLLSPNRIPPVLAEMVRVAKEGGTVALVAPTAASFGEFFSIYWEALHNSGLVNHESDVELLIMELPTVSDIEQLAEAQGLEKIDVRTQAEEFDYESAEAFLNDPLIARFLLPGWLSTVPKASRAQVRSEIARLINEERHEGEFALSVKATLVVGRKSSSH